MWTIVAALLRPILEFIRLSIERGRVASDANPDRHRLSRARDRLREWLRKQDRARPGVEPDQDRARNEVKDLRDE